MSNPCRFVDCLRKVTAPRSLAILLAHFLALTAFAQSKTDPSNPLNDIVAAGTGHGQVVLASLARPEAGPHWRFRKIPIAPENGPVGELQLSSGGTKAFLVFPNGTPRVFDLTRRITTLSVDVVDAPQHTLPQQLFPYTSAHRICLLDDSERLHADECVEATAAAIHEDGRILYALRDGRLVVKGRDGRDQEELVYRLPAGARWTLLAGKRGDARDFLVLTTQSPALDAESGALPTTIVIDPRQPERPIAEYNDATAAALRAQLEFGGEASAGNAENSRAAVDVTSLAAQLEQESGASEIEWSFFRLSAQPEIYSPILEFAPGEPDYPGDMGIWHDIRPLAHGTSRQAYEAAYASMGDKRWSRCTVYTRTLSYPGTWLLEYWYYYPFDEGTPHSHLHDSEHIFVEVDKLGGTVRKVLASDHASYAPNNIYSAMSEDASPVALPLYAMVEFAKHAMAPDLNGDGRFEPGVDENVHTEPYALWGVRDRDTKKHAIMEPYRAIMTLPRRTEDRLSLSHASEIFPNLNVPAARQICQVASLPEDPPCPNCDAATPEAAIGHLVDHPDARSPQNIYKPYVLPWHELRLGVGIFDYHANKTELYVAYAGDLRHMTRGMIGLPARVSVEYMWTPRGSNVKDSLGEHRESVMYAGARFERFLTNTHGVYFGVTPQWTNGVPGAPGWQPGGVWYRLGYFAEAPSQSKGNLISHVGVMFRGSTIRFEWRMSLGVLRRRGNSDFGARRSDRDPYQSSGPALNSAR